MHLRNRVVYMFDDRTASLYRSLRFIADRTLNGYALYTPDEWSTPGSDPQFVVDSRGRIRHRGSRTAYTVEELVACGESAAARRADCQLGQFARHFRSGLRQRHPARDEHERRTGPGGCRRVGILAFRPLHDEGGMPARLEVWAGRTATARRVHFQR